MIVEISGGDELRGLIKDLSGRKLRELFADPVKRNFTEMKRDLADYPPQVPGQRYKRTLNLRRSWTRRTVLKEGVLGFVESNPQRAPYGPFVMDRKRQARIHRGRWQTVEEVRDKHEDAFASDLRRVVRERINDVR